MTATARAQSSNGDRVYTGDQTSNTVSVIDPATQKLLGVIRLGDPVPGALSPLYKGALLVHGLGFSPDHRTLAVISIGSNSVTLIDTTTNRIKGTIYVGRSPHEGFFTPNGRELWVAVRGEDYVSVIDPSKMKEVRRIKTANGPGMVLFRPDGRYAFVPSSFTPEFDVIDTTAYRVVARLPQASPFSPNLAVSDDGKEVWFTLKDTGKVQIVSGAPPFRILATLDTGPITNHVTLADNANGKFAYITVGGLNEVKVYRRGTQPELIATIPTGDLPHGIWHSGNSERVYVGLENSDAVLAIDTLSNKVIATIPIGQTPQALVYVPGAVASGDGTANLYAARRRRSGTAYRDAAADRSRHQRTRYDCSKLARCNRLAANRCCRIATGQGVRALAGRFTDQGRWQPDRTHQIYSQCEWGGCRAGHWAAAHRRKPDRR